MLKPPLDRILTPHDEIVFIAEDDDTFRPASPPEHLERGRKAPPQVEHPPQKPEKILCCGWRRDIRDILLVLDRQVNKHRV